jgi:two-component system cell cycle sensor histidine kinase PleC
MDKDSLPEAMAHFGQIDSSLQRNHFGTGLGLPLVKTLMDLHGGRIEIDSEPNKGTIITVVFPPERVLANEGGIRAAAS